MKVLIVNQFHSDNIGDKLIGETLKAFFESKDVGVQLIGYAQMTEQKICYEKSTRRKIISLIKRLLPGWVKYYLVYKNRIKKAANSINFKNIDAFIIGGGQLIKHGGVFPYCFSDWVNIAKNNTIAVYIYGVGADDGLTKWELRRYLKGFQYAKYVCFRDEQSKNHFQDLVDKYIDVYPDVVFSRQIIPSDEAKEDLLLMPYNYETAHYHFSTLSSRYEYYNDLIVKIHSLEYRKLLLSATTSSDLGECFELQKYLTINGIDSTVVMVNSANELLELYTSVKLLISGRMHALILGSLCELKIIPIMISQKIKDFKSEYMNLEIDLKEIRKQSLSGLEKLYTLINEQ